MLSCSRPIRCIEACALLVVALLWAAATANSQVLALGSSSHSSGIFSDTFQSRGAFEQSDEESNETAAIPSRLQRHVVEYPSDEASGTIIVDSPHTFLYFLLGHGKAIRYGIGVGRKGYTWSGVKQVVRKAEWPDWYPPPEMIKRQPYLPRMMAGGPGNPLGARALYIGGTEYRIHGTNNPASIGKHMSSGCIRLTNDDIMDLYSRVKIGAKVIVLPAYVPLVQRDQRVRRAAQIDDVNSRRAHNLY